MHKPCSNKEREQYLHGHAIIHKEEEQFQYKTGSCNLSVIAFILVVTVVAINIQYVTNFSLILDVICNGFAYLKQPALLI